MKRRLLQPLWFILAVLFLIEAWLWDHLEPWVARIVALIPLRELKAWAAPRIARLSPAWALVVFLVPLIPLYPVKLLALWLFAKQHFLAGLVIFGFAQFIGLGLVAFVFDVTKPKLLQMAWFRRVYAFVLMVRAKAHDIVAPAMAAIRARIRAALGNGESAFSRLMRKAAEVRKRIHAAR